MLLLHTSFSSVHPIAGQSHVWSAVDLLEQIKNVLVFVQFSLALVGLVSLKETSPFYSRLVFSWWTATCGLSLFTIAYACLKVYGGSEVPLLDMCTSVVMGGLAIGYFLGYYGHPDPYENRGDSNPYKSVKRVVPLESICELSEGVELQEMG